MGDNIFVIKTEPKTFQFDLSKGLGINLRHNELLAEHSTKNEICQLFSKYEDGNNIHVHRKQ